MPVSDALRRAAAAVCGMLTRLLLPLASVEQQLLPAHSLSSLASNQPTALTASTTLLKGGAQRK